ncbi:uncharacterized protein LOC110465780 isoform X2 [Mizuhopecten yessoensis]|uniref:uncharacterized protein LOC110465780 isoform X1 n=1 Tax=Mizuhopecten yessoensis TaxID=6573 RepID=UPI000B4585A1|nr:uncharacterized protein LOC110465780 isoform X1 [Mizuhopecten yessoensis]XP_021377532.1 uncharacterized protein LOC110465780 isoform X2 [Mizuhopecten yessoensis]
MGGVAESPTNLVALLMIAVGFVLNTIGFAAPYWVTSPLGSRFGLWMYCDFLDNCYQWDSDGITFAKFEQIRAFEGLGFVGTLAVLLFTVLYLCVPKVSGNKILGILDVLVCFASAGAILIGVIIFGSEQSNLGWAFGLSTAGGILFGLAGVLIILAMCRK